jgi:hypothetical protein
MPKPRTTSELSRAADKLAKQVSTLHTSLHNELRLRYPKAKQEKLHELLTKHPRFKELQQLRKAHARVATEYAKQQTFKIRSFMMNILAAKMKTLATTKLGTREKLELKLKHHQDMNYWHMLKAIHHEKEYKTSGDPKHKLAMEHHMESADYHTKMADKAHNKIMDHIGRNLERQFK